ncbi:MAG: N-acetylmuramoyl-L-alanine amidase [Crocinitomicaceae bacterium]
MMIMHINILKAIILLGLLNFSITIYGQTSELVGGIKTVVIDPGHGGKDPGCHGAHSNEKTIALAIGLKLGEFIETTFPEVNVIYTRKTDVFVELDERAQIANRNKADLFICIHANAGPSNAYGAETYVLGLHRTEAQEKVAQRENAAIQFEKDAGASYETLTADQIIARQLQLSAFLDHSINFAAKLQHQFKGIGRHDRGVRQAGFLVLYKTTMPSVLIETGFLTNKNEENFLASSESQTKMANSIFTAFKEFKAEFEGTDRSVDATLNGIDTAFFGLPDSLLNDQKVVFRVQIETSTTPLDTKSDRFQSMPVWQYESGGLHKYTVGLFTEIEPANRLKKELREKGFEHAFVVAFLANERIDLDKAIKLASN